MKMKLSEDLRRSQEEFLTDDEENQAERECDDDSESDHSTPSRNNSNQNLAWPQSYRQSIDMFSSITSPSISMLRGSSLHGLTGSLTSMYRRNQTPFSPLTEHLIPDVGKGVPTPATKTPEMSMRRLSITSDLPPTMEGCSLSQSILNGVNVLCGVGLLATPFAVREGGWLSLSLLLFYGLISCYTGILLKRCLESSPGLQTYPDIGMAAFGRTGRLIIAIVLYAELYAASVEYLIMMSDNLSRLFPNAQMNIAGVHLNCNQLFAITATLIVLPTVWLRDLSLLSYISVGGILTTFLVVLCLIWIGVFEEVGFHSSGTVLNFTNLPVTIGIYGFCYSGHSVFPNIYSSMKEPSQFPSVIIASFFFCFALNTGVAICAFLMFGNNTKSQFTLNMPTELTTSKVAIWTTAVIPMTKYALTITPIVLSMEELVPPSKLKYYSVSIVIRTVLVISTLVVALTVPFFAIVMSLIGSLLAMLVALIFPCACYLKILSGRLTYLKITGCILIIIVGVVSASLGTYSATTRIAEKI